MCALKMATLFFGSLGCSKTANGHHSCHSAPGVRQLADAHHEGAQPCCRPVLLRLSPPRHKHCHSVVQIRRLAAAVEAAAARCRRHHLARLSPHCLWSEQLGNNGRFNTAVHRMSGSLSSEKLPAPATCPVCNRRVSSRVAVAFRRPFRWQRLRPFRSGLLRLAVAFGRAAGRRRCFR